jgi:hypothetical protein
VTTAVAFLLLAGAVDAATPAAAVTITAPYPGTALHSQGQSLVGCASASDPSHPHFALASGLASMTEKSSATTCPVANGTSDGAAAGTAGLTFVEPWNVSSPNGSGGAAKLVATWSLVWISSVRVSGNGTLSGETEETVVSATFTVFDRSTNQTVGTASWEHPTLFNLTRGSASANASATVKLSFRASLVPGDVYVVTTEIFGEAYSGAQGSGARTVTTTLDLATGGAHAYLDSIQL